MAAGLFLLLASAFASLAAAAEPFESGNAAFRAGDFGAAIEHYREAQAAGDDRAIIDFNIGVAAYRGDDRGIAEAAFVSASREPRLAPRSFYNLGLLAKDAGDDADARVWFNQARRHERASEKIQRLSRRALRTLDRGSRVRPRYHRAAEQSLFREHMRFAMTTGFATDDNVFRAPSSPYVNPRDPEQTIVDPTTQAGTFAPVTLDTGVVWGTHDDAEFALKYHFDGRFYSEQQHQNANVQEHAVTMGGTLDREHRRGAEYSTADFLIARYVQTAFDRADGEEQVAAGVDVSDRYTYTKIGPRVYYRRNWGPFGFGFRLRGHLNQYEDSGVEFLDLTNEQYFAGVELSFKPAKSTLLRLKYDRYQRLYAERLARDLNGQLLVGNENLEYAYHTYGFTYRQRFTHFVWAGLDYRYTQRNDMFVGYNDYERHSARGMVRFHTPRFKAHAAMTYRWYDFPNAFAFDVPTEDPRELNSTFTEVEVSYEITRRFSARVTIVDYLVESNDPRSEYYRRLTSLGVRWEF